LQQLRGCQPGFAAQTGSFASGRSSLHLNRLLKMTDKTYLVRFKPRELGLKAVIAARAEIHGEHIALLNSKGKLAALFLVDIVESWSVLGNPA
jgi:hypothetical protein